MPRNKAIKRKVKDVVVPEGDEGKDLAKADRAAKLESFVEQFDFAVERKIYELEKEYKRDCKAIDQAVMRLIIKMGPAEANAPILDYRKTLLNLGSRRHKDSVCGTSAANAALLTETALVTDPPRQRRKVTGFATPAAGATRQTMWTATPQQTPLFDKRLLNVKAGKPSTGLSFYGMPIPDDVLADKVAKKNLVLELTELLNRLQE